MELIVFDDKSNYEASQFHISRSWKTKVRLQVVLLGLEEGVGECDFVGILQEGVIHVVRVDVEEDWHVHLTTKDD